MTDRQAEKAARRAAAKDRRDRRFYAFARFVMCLLFGWSLRVHVQGRENLPASGSYLLCMNHVSAIDPMVACIAVPRRIRFLAKRELFRIPLVGFLIRHLGACPVDRGGSDVGALRRMIALAREGEVVAVFPQGHRQRGKNPADTPVHDGAGMIACHAGCPIVPVCIKMKKQRYAFLRRTDILIGAPISPETDGAGRDAYHAVVRRAFGEVCRLGGFAPTETEGDTAK